MNQSMMITSFSKYAEALHIQYVTIYLSIGRLLMQIQHKHVVHVHEQHKHIHI